MVANLLKEWHPFMQDLTSFLMIAAAPIQLTEIKFVSFGRGGQDKGRLYLFVNLIVIVFMVVSSYILRKDINENEVLLYSTLTTALIVLEKPIYDTIFVHNDFSNTESVKTLRELGFLVDSHDYELKILDDIYKNEVDI